MAILEKVIFSIVLVVVIVWTFGLTYVGTIAALAMMGGN